MAYLCHLVRKVISFLSNKFIIDGLLTSGRKNKAAPIRDFRYFLKHK